LIHPNATIFSDGARVSAQVRTRHIGQHGHIQSTQRGRATKAWTATHSLYQKERHGKELASLKLRQDFTLQTRLASLAQRERDGEATILKTSLPDSQRQIFVSASSPANNAPDPPPISPAFKTTPCR
jgi:hypothetical protein